MHRLTLFLPGILADESSSVLRDPPPVLRRLAAEAEVLRLVPGSNLGSILGLEPHWLPAPGPLHVAAFRVDPPSRSASFALTLGTLQDGEVRSLKDVPSSEDSRHAIESLLPLETPRLGIVEGTLLEHGLIWQEGSVDLGTHPLEPVARPYREVLPEGDGESLLRRFVDDSVNILSDLPFNHVRAEQGLAPVNIAWPWGPGFTPSLPSLSARFGPVQVESGLLRLAGLTRLVGLKHGDWTTFDRGTATPMSRLRPTTTPMIARIDAFKRFSPQDEGPEREFVLREIDREVLEPWSQLDGPVSVLVVASSPTDGIALHWQSDRDVGSWIPFDERALEESLPRREAHELVRDLLSVNA